MSSGYKVTSRVLDASKMGWPQNRRRFFLVGTRDWDPIELDAVESGLRSETRSIGWALQDVLESGEQSFMMESPVLSSENLRRIDYLHDMDVQNLPDSERPDCHKDGHTYPSVYGRLWWVDRPQQSPPDSRHRSRPLCSSNRASYAAGSRGRQNSRLSGFLRVRVKWTEALTSIADQRNRRCRSRSNGICCCALRSRQQELGRQSAACPEIRNWSAQFRRL